MTNGSARPVRFGLVGCGAISAQHIEAIAAVPGAELTAVMSSSAERARAVGERAGVPWGTDFDALVARPDVDAVVICTPSGLHARQALAALGKGRHVVVEKPLALTVEDADAVVAAAGEAGRVVATISQRRFEPVIQRTRSAVAAAAFGRLVFVIGEGLYHRPQSYYDSAAWRGTSAMDGGVLMNQAIHMVDLVRWIGGPVASVSAHVARLGHEMEAEDVASVSLRFAAGTLGSIVATTCAEEGFLQELRIYGDAGHARIVGDRIVEWVTAPGAAVPDVSDVDAADDPGSGLASGVGPTTWGTDARGHIRQYQDIVDAIQSGRRTAIDAHEGRAALEIVTAAYRSDRERRSIALTRQVR